MPPPAPEWWGNRNFWEIPAREFVDNYLAAISDPEKRLRYLQALETKMRASGHHNWVEAIAKYRLEQQLK